MTQMTPEQITAALDAGIITPSQAKEMRAQAASRIAGDVTIGNEEDLRFIRGFSDIFIAIGIGILMIGIGTMAGLIGSGLGFFVAAAIVVVIADYFGRKKRAHLPTLITAITFLIFILIGAADVFNGTPIFTAIVTLVAMSLFYWRIRLPFCIALITLASLSLAITILHYILPDFVEHQFGWVMLICGLIVLGGGIYYDSKDLHRTTRFSDNAFWLHLTAAPLLIHGLVLVMLTSKITKRIGFIPTANFNQGDAVLMLIIVSVITALGLILNRRALIVSSLSYALMAVGYLLTKSGVSFSMALTATLILVGAAIVLLGVAWHPVRNVMIKALPKSRFIPIAYDPNFK